MITVHLFSHLYDTAKIRNDQSLDYTKMNNPTHLSICLIFRLDIYIFPQMSMALAIQKALFSETFFFHTGS